MKCPTCKKDVLPPEKNDVFPFCSKRCKLVDLGRWIDGEYAIDVRTGKLEHIDPEEAEELEDWNKH